MYYRYYDKESNRLKNYYKLLGIPRDSSDSMIHERFADLHEEGKTNQLIEEAFAVLSTPEDHDRYSRVYDRYNWNYGIQKNSLYENAKPKNRGRSLLILLLFILIGFTAIIFFFFRAPQPTVAEIIMDNTAEPQTVTVVKPETNVADESDEVDLSEEAKPTKETSNESSETNSSLSNDSAPIVIALSVSDEILTNYPAMEVFNQIDNEYPKAEVTSGVNFRNAPTMESKVLSSVGTNETFFVLGKVRGWSYIYREAEGYGWIGGKYIRFTN